MCFYKCVYESSRVDFEKVIVKRKIIGVSWSERRRIQMDLIPSFSFDVSSHHFIVVFFVLSLWCLYPSERVGENTTATQCVIVLVVRLKLYFYSYCFCLDKNILSFGNSHVNTEYLMKCLFIAFLIFIVIVWQLFLFVPDLLVNISITR